MMEIQGSRYTALVYIAVFSMVLLEGACSSRPGDDKIITSGKEKTCYLFTQGRDSIKLSIRNSGRLITGELEFLFFEKDKSRGTIQGEMREDTLIADYTFQSEGVQSLREVVLINQGEAFVLGSGEMQNSGDKEVFKDPKDVRFDTGISLQKVSDCN